MTKIRILFVTDHLDKGGAEKQFLNLVNNIDRNIFQVHVFVAERKGKRFQELREDIIVHGLFGSERRRTCMAINLLRKTISAIRPDIVQSWVEYSTFIAALVLRIAPYKPCFVASQRGSIEELYDHEVKFGKMKTRLLQWAYSQASAVTINTKTLIDSLKRYGVRRPEVIYNGIDLQMLELLPTKEELREKLGFSHEMFLIVFVGALVQRKGIEYLIRAVKKVPWGNVHLCIIGDGGMRKEANKLVGRDRRFSFLGYVPDAEYYIKASDLLVLPSLYEGLPNVILEAMAVGTPVISTSVYGIPELVENGVSGILVPPGDVNSLADAIRYVFENPGTAAEFAEKSRERVNSFGVEKMVAGYEKLYLDSCGGYSSENPSSDL